MSAKQPAGAAPTPPASPASRRVPKVGIVGHSQAGKSTFLAVLLEALVQRDYRVAVDPANSAYRDELTGFINFGFFPPKTPLDEKHRRVSLHISSDVHRAGLEVEFFDHAGEIFERDPDRSIAGWSESRRQDILKDLQACTGLIVLMDLEADPDLLLRTFTNTVVDLQGLLVRSGGNGQSQQKLELPIALLFTKADMLGWQRRQRIRDAQRWITEQSRYRKLTDRVNTYCANAHYYFCSSTGWIEGRPNICTVVRPRPLPGSSASLNVPETELRGENIPDPALSAGEIARAATQDNSTRLRFMTELPVFNDPLRLMAASDLKRRIPPEADRLGVLTLFGSQGDGGRRNTTVTAWNIVEPVLWAAGLEAR
ncbi:TRAFAC clade GTPase domain-containing protein [Azospirillum agricola]|uniref:TRAFAC clade GTPase domain-containing protein n=1 Tax=Azospirillum agricola TaxID=1720247 RepID=UPI000A0F2574|nr:hypothetical protein [Azospirillum agricola]SMH47906.1 hypothetical protein SAMN02982994_2679 [Azospirillum lipoferum]